MTFLNSSTHVIAGVDVGTTLAGTAFWVILVAGWLALLLLTLRSISRAPLTTQSRTRWTWLVVLVPGIGMIIWLVRGPRSRGAPDGA